MKRGRRAAPLPLGAAVGAAEARRLRRPALPLLLLARIMVVVEVARTTTRRRRALVLVLGRRMRMQQRRGMEGLPNWLARSLYERWLWFVDVLVSVSVYVRACQVSDAGTLACIEGIDRSIVVSSAWLRWIHVHVHTRRSITNYESPASQSISARRDPSLFYAIDSQKKGTWIDRLRACMHKSSEEMIECDAWRTMTNDGRAMIGHIHHTPFTPHPASNNPSNQIGRTIHQFQSIHPHTTHRGLPAARFLCPPQGELVSLSCVSPE